MDISKEALESALGEIALLAVEEQKNLNLAVRLAKDKSVRTLQKIQDILFQFLKGMHCSLRKDISYKAHPYKTDCHHISCALHCPVLP